MPAACVSDALERYGESRRPAIVQCRRGLKRWAAEGPACNPYEGRAERTREITRKAKGVSIETIMKELASYMRGSVGSGRHHVVAVRR